MSRLERIVKACGGVLTDGGRRALIPGPGHSANDRSVSLLETEDGCVLIHCFSPKDDWRAVRAALAAVGLLDKVGGEWVGKLKPDTVLQPISENKLARATRIWKEGRSLRCTPALIYLKRRSVEEGADLPSLRFHPRMTSVDDKERRPALLAAIVDASGALQGLQVTLLARYGAGKASVATPRRVIGKLLGGCVRLNKASRELVVGEGVETMLSASRALALPAWAALSAYNLSQFEPPDGVERLVVAIDNDAAGRSAAAVLRDRLAIKVEVVAPPGGAGDWNDVAAIRR